MKNVEPTGNKTFIITMLYVTREELRIMQL